MWYDPGYSDLVHGAALQAAVLAQLERRCFTGGAEEIFKICVTPEASYETFCVRQSHQS